MVGEDIVYSTLFVLKLTAGRSNCFLPSPGGDVGLQGKAVVTEAQV